MLRSLSAAVLALAVAACEPSLPQTQPTPVVTAVFDPTTAQIPLPNDLVFFNAVNGVCPSTANVTGAAPACAQAELLAIFSHGAPANAPALSGEFPSDQEVGITISFTQTNFAGGTSTQTAPDLDLTTLTPSTVFVVGTGMDGASTEMALDPLTDYAKGTDHGTLTIHNLGRQPWPPGQYVVVMRGGPSGVKTKDATPIAVSPSQVFDFVEQGKDMTDPANLGLLRAQTGSTAAAVALGTQLNLLIAVYQQSAFPVADSKFPHQDLAIASTFKIAPVVTNVSIDPARGLAPLPIDLLRNPSTGKLSQVAACALVSTPLAADGTCPNPAAAGFLALDGFSTTGAILAPTNSLIKAATVLQPNALLVYDLSDKNHPVLVDPTTLIIEPCEFTSVAPATPGTLCGSATTALSPVIAIQPSGATAGYAPTGDPGSVFRTRPLKDNTDYAIVLTNTILDKAGNPLGSGTVAKVLAFNNPVVVGGHSALQGIDDGTATSLEAMRSQLVPVFAALTAKGIDKENVAIAYTFHTQTILKDALNLAASPYIAPAATALPGPVTALPATGTGSAFTKYGVLPALPHDNIDEILETDITTFNGLDPATGAFYADLGTNPAHPAPETIHVLIATPKATNPNVPDCTNPALAPFGKCAPMIIFRHGLTRGRADMLLIADTFAAAGMVTVAIDAAKHGDRTLCSSAAGPLSGCLGVCTALPGAAGQGDVAAAGGPPGTCDVAGLAKAPVTTGATGNTDGIAAASGNYLVSANFFRTRDSLRQDLIDESQLVRAIAFIPSGAPPTNHTVFDHIFGHAAAELANGKGMLIDPATIYFSGQSLGAIQGAMDVATNPRISKAGLNVGGGTIVDVFTTSPAFAPAVTQLLAGLGIQPGTSAYLQFLVVAKTILDPADPINFVGHLSANTLPNLLANPVVPQAAKKVLSQMANCDNTVPNPFGFVYAANAGTGPLPPDGSAGTFQLFRSSNAPIATCPGGGDVHHGFLLDFSNPAITGAAQSDLAGFVMSNINPPSVRQF